MITAQPEGLVGPHSMFTYSTSRTLAIHNLDMNDSILVFILPQSLLSRIPEPTVKTISMLFEYKMPNKSTSRAEGIDDLDFQLSL